MFLFCSLITLPDSCPKWHEWYILAGINLINQDSTHNTWTHLNILSHNSGYRQNCSISCNLAGNKIVDHSAVVGEAPAPTTSSFSTWNLASMDWAKKTAIRDDEKYVLRFGASYVRGLTVLLVFCALGVSSWDPHTIESLFLTEDKLETVMRLASL